MESIESPNNTLINKTDRAREVQRAIFLETLTATGNKTASCRRAGITRQTCDNWLAKYPEFKAKYDDAIEQSIDKLELVARNRAIEGVKEPIYYKGELIDHVYRPSDRLMELLLKAYRRERFGDKQQIDLNAAVTIEIAAFAAPNGAQPGGRVIENQEEKQLDRGALIDPPTPQTALPIESEGIDVADFSEIFSEK